MFSIWIDFTKVTKQYIHECSKGCTGMQNESQLNLADLPGFQFHNTLIRLRFNPIYFMQNYTYFKQFYQECLKQDI